MKLIISYLALFVSITAFAGTPGSPEGDDGEFFMNSYLEIVNKEKDAFYKCEIVDQDELGYHVKAYFLTGELKMEGTFTDKDLELKEGQFTYYYQNGQVESAGEYREGAKFGLWKRFDFEGNEKPEKIYATLQTLKAIETFNK